MKKLIFYFGFALLVALSGVPRVMADNRDISFATEEWKDSTQRDGTGLYWDILRAVYKPLGYKVVPVIRSYEGSVKLVTHKVVDAMIGAYEGEIHEGIYPENHFAVDVVSAVFKKDRPFKWHGVQTIFGKRIGWIEGYGYENYLPQSIVESIAIHEVDTRMAAFNLIKLGRIDFYLDAQGDINDFFDAEEDRFPRKNYSVETIFELKLFIVFADTSRGKKLAGLFDKEFSILLKSGEIRKLYDRYSDANFTLPSGF